MGFLKFKKAAKFKRFGTAAAILLALAAPAAGREPVSVKAGQSVTIVPFFRYSSVDCSFLPPSNYRITGAPKHGKAVLATRKFTMPKESDVCPGSSGYVLFLTYTPERGFRGADDVRINFEALEYLDGELVPNIRNIRFVVE